MPAFRSRAARKAPALRPAPAVTAAPTAFGLLPIGIGVFDPDLFLVYANAPFGELRDLPPNLCRPGTPLADIIRFNAGRAGFAPRVLDEQVGVRIAEIDKLRPRQVERDFGAGRRLAV